ncbi:DUF4190 domain-containing protein [Flavobacterium sp. ALJ2]|uniref:DUF4190 domain-containing protein n=1 Tax=Flavobacterium sp. ALJ2 TaxID=2786960 RepID=UPI0018A05F50|nr:DUF4190 domain-containing protein [Flavobacterium sp. ALJ2]MBF7090259.1 DUF4190 domain-containing protein [Flavobacterium sp. ALJ2]
MENNLPTSNAGQGMGIAAFVLGILATIAAFIPCFGLIAILFGVLAIIFGAIGLSQAKNENAPTTMPKAGLILGIVATAFVIIWVLVFVGSIGSAAVSHKEEIGKTLDSINVETKKLQDSLKNSVEITTDTVKIEGEK